MLQTNRVSHPTRGECVELINKKRRIQKTKQPGLVTLKRLERRANKEHPKYFTLQNKERCPVKLHDFYINRLKQDLGPAWNEQEFFYHQYLLKVDSSFWY